ncbi:Na/Pi cotransporter family protein [Mariluticola halotolerans]|uniref:Na/Pi cotransporter family protein n=1 Tax=Mariluticola halotolerans TaxID=2909283 RepID=UPI0026E3835C|nr:Na/Pi cotransporter family protein [Mariluticola halotolerans]UJQ94314.1 Na/Pi cotransporter family protein [Mariluticola halotolerans]
MSLYLLLIHLAGAITLLLWAVRMVRTGVERSQEHRLRRILRESKNSRLKAAGIGAGVAVLLQSSTAVAVLAAGFAGSGALTLATGLALMLGADIGSAVVVQILSVDLSWLTPVLLIAGGLCFFRGKSRETRQLGRILIGISLILLSLGLIGEATEPLRESAFLPTVVTYLQGDFLSAFLIGAAFTWLVHSSVASILLIAAFTARGLVPPELGISLMLGANLGGGLIAAGLVRRGFVAARQIALGNLLFRSIGALCALLVVNSLTLPLEWFGSEPARQVINLHLAFNFALLVICLPLTGIAAKLIERFFPDKDSDEADPLEGASSCLDQAVIGIPALALASATRELLRMAEIIERMLSPIMDIYETGDPDKIRQAKQLEAAVNQAESEIKLYLAAIDYNNEDEAKRGQELSTFAINLEYVGDAITKTLLKLAVTRREQKLSFSAEGWRELSELHHRVMANMQLALNVLISKDRESARQLLAEKDAMRAAERTSHGRHLQRLQSGSVKSMETSDIHLETVRALKTINSLFATIAYPILSESGELLDSRLTGRSKKVKA